MRSGDVAYPGPIRPPPQRPGTGMEANTQTEHARGDAGAVARFRNRRNLSIAAGAAYLAATAGLFASRPLLIARDVLFLWVMLGPLVPGLPVPGFVTYALSPAEPPWLAGMRGHIQHVEQIVPELFRHTHTTQIDSLVENHFANKVAAVPSLHAAFPMMMLLFFWS